MIGKTPSVVGLLPVGLEQVCDHEDTYISHRSSPLSKILQSFLPSLQKKNSSSPVFFVERVKTFWPYCAGFSVGVVNQGGENAVSYEMMAVFGAEGRSCWTQQLLSHRYRAHGGCPSSPKGGFPRQHACSTLGVCTYVRTSAGNFPRFFRQTIYCEEVISRRVPPRVQVGSLASTC